MIIILQYVGGVRLKESYIETAMTRRIYNDMTETPSKIKT